MKNILVPVDFSDTSVNALKYAIRLFEKADAEITALHVFGTHSTALMMKSIDGVLMEDAEKQMNELIEEIKKDVPTVSLNTKFINNSAVPTITAIGNSGDYDFIVMGTKGASGLKEVFIGSVAGGVISKTKAPVIVVPTEETYESVEHIVFAVSDQPVKNEATVNPLIQLAELHSSEVNVLHITSKESPDIHEITDLIQELSPVQTILPDGGDKDRQLTHFLQEKHTDMLCLIRSKKSLMDRLFNESVTMKQTFHSTVPLLILHDE